jgi:hypothetical protein
MISIGPPRPHPTATHHFGAGLAQNGGNGGAVAAGVAVAGEPGASVGDQARDLLAIECDGL